MRAGTRAVVSAALLLSGCRTAHDVAATSYRDATAPVEVVRPGPNQPSTTTVTTTTTTPQPPPSTSDRVVNSAEMVTPPSRPRPTPATNVERKVTAEETKPRPSPQRSPSSSQLEFPTAKPVEGKPGYVYSPFDPSKYVDVSGYAPGSKVKDPYSGKIFVVP